MGELSFSGHCLCFNSKFCKPLSRRFPNKLFHQQNSLQLPNSHPEPLPGTSRLTKPHNERLSVREKFLDQEEVKEELKIEAKMHGMHPRVCSCGTFK